MEISIPCEGSEISSKGPEKRVVTSYLTVKVSTPFLVVCWFIAVWWWSSSLSMVLLSPEEFSSEGEEKRTVSKLILSAGFEAVGEVFRTWKHILQLFF